MSRMILINLPVVDLPKSVAFYRALGFEPNPKFSDESGACMALSETIYVMLLTHAKWQGFTSRPIPARGSSEVSLAMTCDSKAEVDRLVETAGQNGGRIDVNPPEDHHFMYQRTLADPDDHIWEPFWMDPAMASGAATLPQAAA